MAAVTNGTMQFNNTVFHWFYNFINLNFWINKKLLVLLDRLIYSGFQILRSYNFYELCDYHAFVTSMQTNKWTKMVNFHGINRISKIVIDEKQ